jgi:hypothetical protein
VKAWIFVVAALIVGGGTVTAAILYPRNDRARETAATTSPEPHATKASADRDEATASPSAKQGAEVAGQSSGAVEPAAEGTSGRSSVHSVSGEFAESSEGQDQIEAEREADEAELEAEREEDRQKQKEREDRDDDD